MNNYMEANNFLYEILVATRLIKLYDKTNVSRKPCIGVSVKYDKNEYSYMHLAFSILLIVLEEPVVEHCFKLGLKLHIKLPC